MANILVLDDDPLILELVATILETQGHAVTRQADAAAGISQAIAEDGPDLVITDLNMRGVTGWEAVRRIREHRAEGGLPILALSAFTSAQDRDEAFGAGCTAYENKPVDAARLLTRVTALLS